MSKFLLYCSCVECKTQVTIQNLSRHIQTHLVIFALCPKCGKEHNKSGKFCSRSCANSRVITEDHRKKTSQTLKNKNKVKVKIKPDEKEIPYSILHRCVCAHCGEHSLLREYRKYCLNCQHLYSHNGRAKYWFTFNVFHYPDLFNLELITIYGFRNSKTNPNGITRDHRVSVNEAIKNNYDPYYIKHPLNCELMFFDDNNRKNTNSSISYDELRKNIDLYDIKNGGKI